MRRNNFELQHELTRYRWTTYDHSAICIGNLRRYSSHFIPLKHDEFVFMHDNARSHTDNRVNAYVQEPVVVVLQHPSNSPDMNPIEYI